MSGFPYGFDNICELMSRRRRGRSVGLTTRNDRDLAVHFPLASAAIEPLPVRSYVVDSEAIVRDDSALAVFGLSEAMGLSTVLFIG